MARRISWGSADRSRCALAVAWLTISAVQAWLVWGYTVDDAYIVAQYARHLAEGHGWSMNPGGPVTDGVTGPLWVVPGVLAAALGASPVVAAKAVGAICSAAAGLFLALKLGRRSRGRAMATWAVLVLAVQPTFATWASAGLSSGLAALLVCLALPGPRLARTCLAPWAAAAMFSLRPELVPMVCTLVGLPEWLRRGAVPSRRLFTTWGPVALGATAILCLRIGLGGDGLPLAVHAKPASLTEGVRYLTRGLVMTTSGVGVLLAMGAYRFGQPRDRVVASALLVGLVSVVLAGGDWMPGFRLLAPMLPLYAWCVAVTVGGGAGRAGSFRHRAWFGAAVALSWVLPLVDFWMRVPELEASHQSRQRVGEPMARAIAAASDGGVVAAVDIGYVAYRGRVSVFDLGGVTDPDVARLPGGHLSKAIPEAMVIERDPTLLLLHARTPPVVAPDGTLMSLPGYPVERRVARMPWVRAHFRVIGRYAYAPHYHYVLLARADRSGAVSAEAN